MPVLIACPTCLQKIRAPETVVGRQIKCPQCKNPFIAADSNSVPNRAAIVRDAAVEPAAEFIGSSSAIVRPTSSVDLAVAEPGAASIAREFESEPSPFVEFLLLRRPIAPKALIVLYYAGLVFLLVMGLLSFVASVMLTLQKGLPRTIGLLLAATTLFGIPLLIVAWRLLCEIGAGVAEWRRLSKLNASLPPKCNDS